MHIHGKSWARCRVPVVPISPHSKGCGKVQTQRLSDSSKVNRLVGRGAESLTILKEIQVNSYGREEGGGLGFEVRRPFKCGFFKRSDLQIPHLSNRNENNACPGAPEWLTL